MVFEVENAYKRTHKRFSDQQDRCNCKRCQRDKDRAKRVVE